MPDATGVTYQTITIAGQSVRLFSCSRHAMQLTVEGCAGRFKEALSHGHNDVSQFVKCRDCPIGAAHSGLPLRPPKPLKECARCGQWASRIINSTLCTSCFNREREVLKGRDRRGRPPATHNQFWNGWEPRPRGRIPQLFQIAVIVDGKPETYLVASLRECLEQAVKRHHGQSFTLAIPDAARLMFQIPRT